MRFRIAHVLAALVLPLAASGALAQGFGGGRGGFNLDPSMIRQQVTGRLQAELSSPDEEWIYIEPKLWRIICLQAQTGSVQGFNVGALMRGRGRGGGGFGGGGGMPGQVQANFDVNQILGQLFNNGQPMLLLQKQQELLDMLQSPLPSESGMTLKLQEIRNERARINADLTTAREALTRILTLRQEAILLQGGYLE